jgi:hypothetical protein
LYDESIVQFMHTRTFPFDALELRSVRVNYGAIRLSTAAQGSEESEYLDVLPGAFTVVGCKLDVTIWSRFHWIV